MKRTHLSDYAWGVLIFNLGVIAWGAYVRASGSGAGCGSHWPLCNGVMLPRAPRVETLIEFIHRATSGLAFLLVVGLLVWVWRVFPAGSRQRYMSALAMTFMVSEALVGAGLVLFEMVADNASTARAWWISAHLVNTFLLLGFLSLTAWWAIAARTDRLAIKGAQPWLLGIGLAGMLILGMSGAITALGDTLFPAGSLVEGLQQDLSPTAHFLVRLRILHPTIAVLVSAYLVLLANWFELDRHDRSSLVLGRLMTALILVQLSAGLLNVALLAPIWLQLIHLLLSDALWITLVLFTIRRLAASALENAVESPSTQTGFAS
ncbi:MAG TPA: COX15/CtaA family protein [Anaerolineales bacterium]|nr:COX15/CtaA family protein [Anaerolineales bacterium]